MKPSASKPLQDREPMPILTHFWRTPSEWPNDPTGYVFLARAFNEIGPLMFGDKWPRQNDSSKTKLTYAQLLDAAQQLSDDELSAPDEVDDQKAMDAHRMWVAVKDEIVKGCSEGRLVSAVRPKAGGKTEKLEQGMWHSERLDHRFCSCEMSLASPFRKSRLQETHWIYLGRESLGQYFLAQPNSPNVTEMLNHISPYLSVMLAVTKTMQITAQNQPKKESVIDEIIKTWSGPKLSQNLVKTMATLIREPESQLGRAKKK
jgi:hypothetical protein